MEESVLPPVAKENVQCVVCGYTWKTRTKLMYISCPNCRHTNKTLEARSKYSEKNEEPVKPALHLNPKKINPFVAPEESQEDEEDSSELKRMNRIAQGDE